MVDSRAPAKKEVAHKERKEVAKGIPYPTKKCYINVAEQLPPDVTTKDIMDTLPRDIFEKSYSEGSYIMLKTVVSTVLSLYLLTISPWYLLPFAWIFAGTAFAGIFVAGHDCGHRSLFPSVLLNDIVGDICHTFLLYPYHAWRIQHNHHHAHTNKLHVDNAWQPTHPDKYKSYHLIYRAGLRLMKGFMWNTGSIGHELVYHFDVNDFSAENQPCVRRSIYFVYAFGLTFIPAMIYFAGFWGFCSYYVIPWAIYHFWVSTFTLVHHTLPHIPFKDERSWKLVDRFSSTVHCHYPFWVEWLCHDINVHIPHHLTTNIPCYKLTRAHNILKQTWGKYMHEVVFGWELMYDLATTCHMYHHEKYYQTFNEFWENDAAQLKKAA